MKYTFNYKAADGQGRYQKGQIQAESRDDAYRQITAANLKPLRITQGRSGGKGRARVTLKDLAQFTYQFSVLMEARISIVEGVRAIAEQEPKERFKRVLEDVARQIEGGHSVTEALEPHERLFGEVYVETIRGAEKTGNMIEALRSLSEMLERQAEISKGVKGALIYPACVVGALTLAVAVLMIFVVPRFAEMFSARNVALPLPTQLVIGFSDLLRSYWYLFIASGIGLFFLLRAAWRDPAKRRLLDNWLHKVPYVRDVLRGLAISRFTKVLGISLRSGLNLIDALEMGGRASGRPLLLLDAEKMRDQVNVGGRLSDVIITCQYLPSFTRRMIAAGEEAGELPRMCEIVARDYDREVVQLTKNVSTFIEPIMIVGLAGVVLLIALAIFLPMWNMAQVLGA